MTKHLLPVCVKGQCKSIVDYTVIHIYISRYYCNKKPIFLTFHTAPHELSLLVLNSKHRRSTQTVLLGQGTFNFYSPSNLLQPSMTDYTIYHKASGKSI
jgi:hypothetical protein